MADPFQTSRINVIEHIRHVYKEGESEEISICQNFRQIHTEGKRPVDRGLPYYNLDMIILVGHRVRSRIAIYLRHWATQRLKEYLVKGFTTDDARLKQLGGGDYWEELLD